MLPAVPTKTICFNTTSATLQAAIKIRTTIVALPNWLTWLSSQVVFPSLILNFFGRWQRNEICNLLTSPALHGHTLTTDSISTRLATWSYTSAKAWSTTLLLFDLRDRLSIGCFYLVTCLSVVLGRIEVSWQWPCLIPALILRHDIYSKHVSLSTWLVKETEVYERPLPFGSS